LAFPIHGFRRRACGPTPAPVQTLTRHFTTRLLLDKQLRCHVVSRFRIRYVRYLKYFQEYRRVSRNYVRFCGGLCGILYLTRLEDLSGICAEGTRPGFNEKTARPTSKALSSENRWTPCQAWLCGAGIQCGLRKLLMRAKVLDLGQLPLPN